MRDDIILNKSAIIEKCIERIHEEYENEPENLNNITKQDSIILNIQRACEAAIDLSMHIIAVDRLGIPQTSREAFELLYKKNYITEEFMNKLKAMIGFRNIAIHNYQKLNIAIIQSIITKNISDLNEFCGIIINLDK